MLELSLEADTVEIVGSHLWDCHNSWFAGELGWLWAELGMIMIMELNIYGYKGWEQSGTVQVVAPSGTSKNRVCGGFCHNIQQNTQMLTLGDTAR